jgi:integrase
MEQEKTIQSGKSKSETIQRSETESSSGRLAKTHEDYWKGRLRRRAYRLGDGESREVPEWQVQLGRDGRQRWISLGTANKDAAAKLARDTWLKLKTLGWDAVKPARERIVDPSVGDFLAAVRAEADLAAGTFEIYARKFRRLVAGVVGIEDTTRKHDYTGGGYDEWLARVHGVKLSRLSPEAVQRWKTKHIAAAARNPLQDRRARRTVASVLRSSKALFAAKIVGRLHMELPTPLPLSGVDIPRVGVAQYVSHINPGVLFQQAQRELEQPDEATLRAAVDATERRRAKEWEAKRKRRAAAAKRAGRKSRGWTESDTARANRVARAIAREREHRGEMFRVLCLALFAGLRRDEIDTLLWRQVDFENHTIRIETNEFTRAKSEGSETSVDIDPTLTERLRGWMEGSTSPFVIGGTVEARPEVSTYHHYRCDCLFKKLTAWLKAHGVEDRNALHALRKEFGTQINRSHGLFAASAALRHSSIQLTRAVYVAKKDRAVFAMPDPSPSAEKVTLHGNNQEEIAK